MKRELFPTQQMQREVVNFYSQIFIFLSDVMGWMTRKRRERFMGSFNEDFNERFEGQVERIRDTSKRMRTLAMLGTSAEQRVVRLEIEEIGLEIQDIRTVLEGNPRDCAEQVERMERLERKMLDLEAAARDDSRILKQLASDVVLLLQGQALQYIDSQPPERKAQSHLYQRVKLTTDPQTDICHLLARNPLRRASLPQHRHPNVSPPPPPPQPHR